LAAIDFTTIEVWTKGGLVTFYLLFVIELASRRIYFAGCTPNPQERDYGKTGAEKARGGHHVFRLSPGLGLHEQDSARQGRTTPDCLSRLAPVLP
jgi:hypothetical protein